MQKNIRQLAAIMFTDMVGYTAQMQSDENKAKKNRDRHRQVLEQCTTDHHGIILQYYGDGTLSVFGSAIEAVECAIEIQQNLQKSPKIPLRIGLHIGDIVYADDGVYGDAVNIASRIENLSVPGSILISGKVYDEIKNHPDLPAKALGKYELKNVNRPVYVFAIEKDGLVTPSAEIIKGKIESNIKSIAVLPFVNISADPENEYFSDGITEELLNALTKVDGLQVTSRTSAFAFKGKNEDIRNIGKQLNVTYVLEGSVRKAGKKVRITAQLIKTADGYHIWSEIYDRTLEDIFEIQDEISGKITHTLREKLTVQKKQKLTKQPIKNIDAYNKYLKARFHYNKWSPEEAKKAIQYFEEAIQLEEDFALAYAGISNCFALLGSIGQVPPETAFSKSKEMAKKAIEKDSTLAEPYSNLAWIQFFYDLNWKRAEQSFKKALSLNPDSAETHQAYSIFLLVKSELTLAMQEIELALKLDPLSTPINFAYAFVLKCAGRIEDSLRQFDKILELDSNFKSAKEGKAFTLAFIGKHNEAMKLFEEVSNETQGPLKGITGLGYVYAKRGDRNKAEEYIQKLRQRQKEEKDVTLHMDFAIIYAGLDDTDKVLYHFEKAFEKRAGLLMMFADPGFEKYRNEPRFKDLMKKIII